MARHRDEMDGGGGAGQRYSVCLSVGVSVSVELCVFLCLSLVLFLRLGLSGLSS